MAVRRMAGARGNDGRPKWCLLKQNQKLKENANGHSYASMRP